MSNREPLYPHVPKGKKIEKKISLEDFLRNIRAGQTYLLVVRRLSMIIDFDQCFSREHAEELAELWRKKYGIEGLTYEIYFATYYYI